MTPDQQKKFDTLQRKLRELFMLDFPELDFGIYRIMNHKRREIEQFLAQDLLPQVRSILAENQSADVASIRRELENLEKTLHSAGVDPNANNKVLELRRTLAHDDPDALAPEIYFHLTTFFSRYYDSGDFISQRRYKNDVYAIPYQGEEVKLHWANHDQYYIKTAEHFKTYRFRLDEQRLVTFTLAEVTTDQNNNKSSDKRAFALADADFLDATNPSDLTLTFTYLPTKTKQADLNRDAFERIKTALADPALHAWLDLVQPGKGATPTNTQRSLLEKHLTDYTARNTFDYFIHKDLGKFLHRELDFYIKNEILFIDDIGTLAADEFVRQIGKIKAIKAVGEKIIAFLAQLENFQKKLWLKKKFVTDTHYCITLDRIPADFYAEIAANTEQTEEWVRLFRIDLIEGGPAKDLLSQPVTGFSRPLSVPFLQDNPFLTLDTAFFSEDFKARLLAQFHDLDNQIDGLLIHGENFQALGLLQQTYRERVKCVYIDPPYNTGGDGFLYKDSYRHSSWLSMIHDRLELTRDYLNDAGVLYSSIDAVEATNLEIALNNIFGIENRVEEIIWAQNSNKNQSPTFSTNHEYVPVYSKDISVVKQDFRMFREVKPGLAEIKALIDELNPDYPLIKTIEAALRNLYKKHKEEVEDEENDEWKGIYNYNRVEYRDANGKMVEETEAKKIAATIWVWREGDASMPQVKEDSQKSAFRDPESPEFRFYRPIHPKTGKPSPPPKRGWVWPFEAHGNQKNWFNKLADDNRIAWGDNEEKIPQAKKFLHEVETNVAKSIVIDFSDGEKQLTNIFGKTRSFSNPKPTTLIGRFIGQCNVRNEFCMDYFAGSGTTAHAVINLNREDNGQRKYILVEMGEYFDAVTKPRVLKAAYSKDWSGGVPVSRAGVSHCMKYIRLESYEDTLNNLLPTAPDAGLWQDAPAAREEYLLHYLLDFETRDQHLDLARFRKPFDYRLRITRSQETREQGIDLVETFNYLIGLRVAHRWQPRPGLCLLRGHTRAGERTLVIWRDCDTWDNVALNAFLEKSDINPRDGEFDRIYVNGDNNVENLKTGDERWKVVLTEEEFLRRMFENV